MDATGQRNTSHVQLTLPAMCAESIYFVARSGRHTVGAAELRKREDGLFLNYIGVRQDSQGNGVGTALLSRAVKLAGRQVRSDCPRRAFRRTRARSGGMAASGSHLTSLLNLSRSYRRTFLRTDTLMSPACHRPICAMPEFGFSTLPPQQRRKQLSRLDVLATPGIPSHGPGGAQQPAVFKTLVRPRSSAPHLCYRSCVLGASGPGCANNRRNPQDGNSNTPSACPY